MTPIASQFLSYLAVLICGFFVVLLWMKKFKLDYKNPRTMLALKLAATVALSVGGAYAVKHAAPTSILDRPDH